MKNAIAIGDEVAYSVEWLRSVGQYSAETANQRGIVLEFKNLGQTTLAKIKSASMPSFVNVANLARVGSLAFRE
jgi:hypothetical protein